MGAAARHKVKRVRQQEHAAYTIALAILEDAPAKNGTMPLLRLLALPSATAAAHYLGDVNDVSNVVPLRR